jgi:pyrimidine operon attenuation protein/uracil phosphoribosyltransferase
MAKQEETVLVMDAEAIRKAIRRIAHEIIERNEDLARVVVAGIPTRGVEVARRIIEHIEAIEGVQLGFGIVDVYISTRGRPTAVVPTQLPLDLDGRTIVLVDDVLFTGRSCRAALDAITSFGRPARIQYAVLIDRGHRELPIRADYVGKNLPTAREERIRVRFEKLDGTPDSVTVVRSS